MNLNDTKIRVRDVIMLLLGVLLVIGVGSFALKPFLVDRVESLPWKWGMDFNGGVRLIYRIDNEAYQDMTEQKRKKILETSRNRLYGRVAAFNSEESMVVILGDSEILVEIPGVRNISKVKKDIGKQQFLTLCGVIEQTDVRGTGDGWHQFQGQWLRLSPPAVTGEHILTEQLQEPTRQSDGKWQFELPLNGEGRDRFMVFSSQYVNKMSCMLLDDNVVGMFKIADADIRRPVVSSPTRESAREILAWLRSGPLPARFDLVSEESVEPMAAALRSNAVRALSLGAIIMIIFFIASYIHRPYFVFLAVCTFLFEISVLLCCINGGLLTISMPQTAGLALLLGMSVDGLVLVFEHLEQTVRPQDWFSIKFFDLTKVAVHDELRVILWASISTILALGGLYFVPGVLHEYFILLSIGITVSLFGAIYLRLMMSCGILGAAFNSLSKDEPYVFWMRLIRGFDLVRYIPLVKKVYLVLVPLALLIILIYTYSGGVVLGTEFAGGLEVRVSFDSIVDAPLVRKVANSTTGQNCQVMASSNGSTVTIRIPKPKDRRVKSGATTAGSPDGKATSSDTAATNQDIRGDSVDVDELVRALSDKTASEAKLLSVKMFGPSMAIWSILSSLKDLVWGFVALTLLTFCLYISVKSSFYIALALITDIILMLSVLLVFRIPVDYTLIAALLTFAGYSINDSIVICQEMKIRGTQGMPEILLQSMPEELDNQVQDAIQRGLNPMSSRVFLTTITTILPMIPLLFCDGVLFMFGLVFTVGPIIGTFSSIYIVGANAREIVLSKTRIH